mmetsp:Transcript_16017/g.35102  ORF Transcript_16017/g.35102 Transcript_16017/m.35102 type:complete len:206 (-) Transcript_16017:18-635(-)
MFPASSPRPSELFPPSTVSARWVPLPRGQALAPRARLVPTAAPAAAPRRRLPAWLAGPRSCLSQASGPLVSPPEAAQPYQLGPLQRQLPEQACRGCYQLLKIFCRRSWIPSHGRMWRRAQCHPVAAQGSNVSFHHRRSLPCRSCSRPRETCRHGHTLHSSRSLVDQCPSRPSCNSLASRSPPSPRRPYGSPGGRHPSCSRQASHC